MDANVKILRRFVIYMAILTFVMFTLWAFVKSFRDRPPGDYETEVCDIRLKDKEYDKALSFTELNNKLYPNEGVIWDTMGEIYFETNQRDKAIHCFNKALELKSEDSFCFWCEHSSKQLEKLKLQ